jgi:formylglycine-generating enzyme required for sulfatase activity
MRSKAKARSGARGFCLAHDIVGGANRVLRGGSWLSSAQGARVALRYGVGPAFRFDYLGFRLAYDSTKGEQHEKEE